MTNTPLLVHGVMEGNGAYNRHAQTQAGASALATPFLERAAEKIALDTGHQPVIIADYGSAQGKNSLSPVGTAIRRLRLRLGPDRPICVFHIDQPANDFNSLFEVLTSDPDRYTLNQPGLFPGAIGRSFYEQVLPPESVHLGWSANAAMWLRRVPSLIPGHFWSGRSTGPVRAAFERQAAEDWEAFLSLRAREMRPGARLVVVLPTVPNDQSSGVAELMDHANAVLQQMVNEGAITADERARMVLGAHPRRKDELLAPFAEQESFQKLILEDYTESVLPDPAWIDYQKGGNKEVFASKRAAWFRSTFVPSLASALSRAQDGDHEALHIFASRFEEGLTERLLSRPGAAALLVQIVVLAKNG